jgi:hypothetical protein
MISARDESTTTDARPARISGSSMAKPFTPRKYAETA